MFTFILRFIHQVLDYALSTAKLVQNREVGWKCLNRKTGQYHREQQPLLKKLKLWLLFSRPVEWVDRTHLVRRWIHDKTIQAGKCDVRFVTSFVNKVHRQR
jgi:phosphatidylserine decarboxylase